MPSSAVGKWVCPESQPNRLLSRENLPPVDSTKERLGSRRRSSSLRSAASRKAAAYRSAGQSARWKKLRRVSSLGSLRYSGAGVGARCGDNATGTAAIPATNTPLVINFIMLETPENQNLEMSGAHSCGRRPSVEMEGGTRAPFAGNYGAAISRDYNTMTDSARGLGRRPESDGTYCFSAVLV